MFQGDSLLCCFDLGNSTGLSSFAEKKKLLSIVGAMNNKEVSESSVFCFLKASLGLFVAACFCYFFFLLVSKTNWYGLNLISCPGRKLGLFLPLPCEVLPLDWQQAISPYHLPFIQICYLAPTNSWPCPFSVARDKK